MRQASSRSSRIVPSDRRGFSHDATSELEELRGAVETRVVILQARRRNAHVVLEHANRASLPDPRGNEVTNRVRAPTPATPANKHGNSRSPQINTKWVRFEHLKLNTEQQKTERQR